jgi:hypothetical protein
LNDKRIIEETRRRSRGVVRWYVGKLRRLADLLRKLDGPALEAVAKTARGLLNGLADKITAGWLADDINREGAERE